MGLVRRTLCGACVLALILAAGYCLTAPASHVQVVAEPAVDAIVQRSWSRGAARGLVLLLPSSLTSRLDGLPATITSIERTYPWNATIGVGIGAPDIAIRQDTMAAVVFMTRNRAFAVTEIDRSWSTLDVYGFPTSSPGFLDTCLQYASLCRDLLTYRSVLHVERVGIVPGTGMVAELEDGKRLIFGDSSESLSKVQRALAVVKMTAFESQAVTVDLRFEGQAVIPGTP